MPEKPFSLVKNNKYLPFSGRFYKAIHRRLATGTKKAVTFAATIYLSRYASVEVPYDFVIASEKTYMERLVKQIEPVTYNMDSIKMAVRQFGMVSLKKFYKSLSKIVSVSATCERHMHGGYGVIDELAPKVSYTSLEGQSYEGICPAPYFCATFTDLGEFRGNATHICEP